MTEREQEQATHSTGLEQLLALLVEGRLSIAGPVELGRRTRLVIRSYDAGSVVRCALSRRESEVYALAASGSPYKVIADSLGIALPTAATLLSRARQKLGGGAAMLLLQHV